MAAAAPLKPPHWRKAPPGRVLGELYRRDPAKPEDVNFGLNVIPETTGGTIRVGDPVTVYS